MAGQTQAKEISLEKVETIRYQGDKPTQQRGAPNVEEVEEEDKAGLERRSEVVEAGRKRGRAGSEVSCDSGGRNEAGQGNQQQRSLGCQRGAEQEQSTAEQHTSDELRDGRKRRDRKSLEFFSQRPTCNARIPSDTTEMEKERRTTNNGRRWRCADDGEMVKR